MSPADELLEAGKQRTRLAWALAAWVAGQVVLAVVLPGVRGGGLMDTRRQLAFLVMAGPLLALGWLSTTTARAIYGNGMGLAMVALALFVHVSGFSWGLALLGAVLVWRLSVAISRGKAETPKA